MYSLPLRIGKQYALATSPNDSDWSKFVYWIVSGSFKAEEDGITQEEYMDVEEVSLLGPTFQWMFRGAIFGVGNYGEMYAHDEVHPPRSGKNLLNGDKGPMFYPSQF